MGAIAIRGWLMNMVGAVVGGVLGGLVGAAVWATVTFYSGWEIGWIAWGIGGLVGLGVRLGSRSQGGIGFGTTAVILAIAAVLLGKLGTAHIELSAFLATDEAPLGMIADFVVADREAAGRPVRLPPEDLAESLQDLYPPDVWSEAVRRWEAMDPNHQELARAAPILANPQFCLVSLADEVVYDYEHRGRVVAWPPTMSIEFALHETHYPAEVWAEAVHRWNAMSSQEQEAYKASITRDIEQGMAFGQLEMLGWWFIQSFSLFDILWVGFAVWTAAKIGAHGPRRIAVPGPLEAEVPPLEGSGLRPPPDSPPS